MSPGAGPSDRARVIDVGVPHREENSEGSAQNDAHEQQKGSKPIGNQGEPGKLTEYSDPESNTKQSLKMISSAGHKNTESRWSRTLDLVPPCAEDAGPEPEGPRELKDKLHESVQKYLSSRHQRLGSSVHQSNRQIS